MNDDFSRVMTPFDQYTSTQSLQMFKIIIPFLPPKTQRMMAIYVKFLELQHTLTSFHNIRLHSDSPEDIWDSLRPYLSPSDSDSIEQMYTMMNMMSMMQEMQNMPDTDETSTTENETDIAKEGESYDGLDE